jgi:hypothetical protein
MECVGLILEQIVQIIHYIAWPIVVLIILLVFHNEIRNLIGRFTEYEGRYGKFRFGETRKIPSQQFSEVAETPAELSKEAKKILATLWERQTYHFKENFSRRWSFRILPNAEGYGIFIVGFAELIKTGLVGWTPKDGQAILSDKGIEYIKEHREIQESEDIYRF